MEIYKDAFYFPMVSQFYRDNKWNLVEPLSFFQFIKRVTKDFQTSDLFDDADIITLPKGYKLYNSTSFFRTLDESKTKTITDIFERTERYYDIMSFSDRDTLENSNRDFFLGQSLTQVGRVIVYTASKPLTLYDMSQSYEKRKEFHRKAAAIINKYFKKVVWKWRCKEGFCPKDGIARHIINFFLLQMFNQNPNIDGIRFTDYVKKWKQPDEEAKLYPEIQIITGTKDFPLEIDGIYFNNYYFRDLDVYHKFLVKYLDLIRTMEDLDIRMPRVRYDTEDILQMTAK